MSMDALKWAYGLRDPELRHPRKTILVALAYHANNKGECWPKQSTLAAECGVNETTVRRCLAWLADAGYVERQLQRRDDGTRRSDLYRLDQPGARHGREAEPNVTVSCMTRARARTNKEQLTSEPTTRGSSNLPSSLNVTGNADGGNSNGVGSSNGCGREGYRAAPTASAGKVETPSAVKAVLLEWPDVVAA